MVTHTYIWPLWVKVILQVIHMTFKIIVNLILFPSLMRALLSCLSCSSSSMMICSSHSNFLLILFIRLLWLASSNFFVMALAPSSTFWFWLFTMASCFATGSLFCWGCWSSFQRPRLKLITLSEEKHPGAKCYIDVNLTSDPIEERPRCQADLTRKHKNLDNEIDWADNYTILEVMANLSRQALINLGLR